MTMHPDWIVPDWPVPSGVRAIITTRAGGVSRRPYDSFNLGVLVGDDPAAVAENRARLRAVLPSDPVWLRQVHGADVVDADAHPELPHADASIASRAGTVCVIQVADCIPVLFADRTGSTVAAAHAGWRGLAAGVLAHTVQAMAARGTAPCDILAHIGPGIGPDAFEVGAEVRAAFTAQDDEAAHAFKPKAEGKWMANLHWLARRALERAGVTHIYGNPLCTVSDPSRFYSYRRDKITGRMAALIWRTS
ncbi:MAG TPA: peptidoglycan editing factor PgeF [Burkholderiales bacterium]